jgi:hypothetical protein
VQVTSGLAGGLMLGEGAVDFGGARAALGVELDPL